MISESNVGHEYESEKRNINALYLLLNSMNVSHCRVFGKLHRLPRMGSFGGPGGRGNLEWFRREEKMYEINETPSTPPKKADNWSESMAVNRTRNN
jgi:hypothetical protein